MISLSMFSIQRSLGNDFMSDAPTTAGEGTNFLVSVEAFTGPVDLLCVLVESRQIDICRIPLTDIVRAYGQYLTRRKDIPLPEVADFFHQAATLLLYKVLSLFPVNAIQEDGEDFGDGEFLEDIERRVELFAPYRIARESLILRKSSQDRRMTRVCGIEGPVNYDIGDVYALSTLWWDIARRKKGNARPIDDEEHWAGVPDPIPDETLIDRKVEELTDIIRERKTFSISSLLHEKSDFSVLLVTILALLEMCRMGRIRIRQEEVFGDVVAIGSDCSFSGGQDA